MLLHELSVAGVTKGCILEVLVDGQVAECARLSSAEVLDLQLTTVTVQVKLDRVVVG